MAKPVPVLVPALAMALSCASPVAAQQPVDPVTRFIKGLFNQDDAPPAASPAPPPPAAVRPTPEPSKNSPAPPRPAAPAARRTSTDPAAPSQPGPPAAAPAKPVSRAIPAAQGSVVPGGPKPAERAALPGQNTTPTVETKTPVRVVSPRPDPAPAAETRAAPAKSPAPQALGKPAVAPVPAAEPVKPVAAPHPVPAQASVPTSPAAALERVNAYFNNIDQLTASFVQSNASGQAMEGALTLKRPGQLRFVYLPPSTLEVVSDGRSVAVRDKKLGTNDVYPVGQTPLKFLLKDDFDLSRDTQVRDVQTTSEGFVTVKFEDSATFGGTSKITLRFDAKAGRLKGWSVLDPQGFETTVTLSDVAVVQRTQTRVSN
jgi:outer membrane lipoprotein-sorting protein